jgi:hypothetical protein
VDFQPETSAPDEFFVLVRRFGSIELKIYLFNTVVTDFTCIPAIENAINVFLDYIDNRPHNKTISPIA